MSPSTIKITAVSIVLFIIASGSFAFIFLQTQQQGEKLVAQLDTLTEQRTQEEAFFRLRRVAEESSAERSQLSEYFFAGESESIDFLNMVEQLAPEAGVTLETNSLNLIEGTESED
jgi:predicted PurR-regulated permease PerM